MCLGRFDLHHDSDMHLGVQRVKSPITQNVNGYYVVYTLCNTACLPYKENGANLERD